MAETPKAAGAFSDPDLMKRIGSALIMAMIAVATAWWGGWPFALMWCIASFGVLTEWLKLSREQTAENAHDYPLFWFYLLPLGALLLWQTGLGSFGIFAGLLGVCALILFQWAPQIDVKRIWAFAGLLYALPVALGPVVLRQQDGLGFAAILWLFALVWGTDVAAYFCGRGIGGPKLWPSVSPKKTWSGFIGGTLIGTLVAVLIVKPFGIETTLPLVVVTYLLAVLSQGGDLLESSVKRHFDAKDSSGLIPGHGGLMDRLDAFLVVAGVAALIGLVRSGDVAKAAAGILVW